MVFNRKKEITPEDLLKDIEGLNASPDVLSLFKRFIEHQLLGCTGAIIISTQGKHINLDGTKFSEAETVWIGQKLSSEAINKRVSFND